MPEFAAEQYISGTDTAAAERRADVARRAAEQLTREGTPVEFVRWIFIPQDETCIQMYRAGSIDVVRLVAARASLRFEHISEAVTETGERHRSEGELDAAQPHVSEEL
jgi:hypothetical protein